MTDIEAAKEKAIETLEGQLKDTNPAIAREAAREILSYDLALKAEARWSTPKSEINTMSVGQDAKDPDGIQNTSTGLTL